LPFFYTRTNIIRGALIYTIGDSTAALIVDEFSLLRLLAILFLGGVVYAFEIPNLLLWINDHYYADSFKNKFLGALIFSFYFNPLWIARHLLIINLFQGNFDAISWDLLTIGFRSFIYSLPFVFPMNYMVTNVVRYNWRFTVSGIISGIMALYYALSESIFGK
jgi:hypothetical protein